MNTTQTQGSDSSAASAGVSATPILRRVRRVVPTLWVVKGS